MNSQVHNNEANYIHYKDPLAIKSTSDVLITCLPKNYTKLVVLCIGTDRSTGDSLGPLTGTLLTQMRPTQMKVYGTLHHPVHAVNLEESIQIIKKAYRDPFIIAIDASLGKNSSIGNLISGSGPLKPGAALKKELPAVGDAYITGVVNIGGFMDYAVLQSTRLSIVHDMAYKIALVLKKIDFWLHHYKSNQLKSLIRKHNESV